MKNRFNFKSQISRAVLFVWKGSPFWMVFSTVLQILQGVFPILSLILLQMMVDEVTAAAGGQGNYRHLVLIILLTGAVTLLSSIFSHLGGWASQEQSRYIADYMNGILMKKGGEVDFPYYENAGNQDKIEQAAIEAYSRPNQIVSTLAGIVQYGVSLAGVIFLIYRFNPLIILILFLSALPGLISRIFFSNKVFLNERRVTEKERLSGYYRYLMLYRDCAKEVRLFNLTEEVFRTFTNLRQELRNIRHVLDRRTTIVSILSSTFMVVLVFAAYIWVAKDVIAGTVTVGAFIMFYQAFQRGQSFLRSFLGSLASLYEHNLFLQNLYQFLDYQPLIKAPEEPVNPPLPVRGEIVFKDVSFSYPDKDSAVLKGVNLHLVPGEVVALVGRNGCGKTTLIKLLCRLYDVSGGSISLDGIDLRKMETRIITDSVGVIFQDYMKYSLSVTQNIAYGDMSKPVERDRIREAAKKAGIHDMIEALPQGYESVLGVNFTDGQELSGGQWQKIAMARAFYKDSPVIILDEPTSSLDPKAEYEIFDQMKNVLADKTALLVSHRMATVRMADKICVMDDGRIAEEGTHDQLMGKKGIYYDLFMTQAMNYR